MLADEEITERTSRLIVRYSSLLSKLVRDTKPKEHHTSEVHKHFFTMFAELLCQRDEFNAFSRSSPTAELSVFDAPAFLDYEDLYAFLASRAHNPIGVKSEGSHSSMHMCDGAAILCRRGLHCFGKTNTRGDDTEEATWIRIRDKYFPHMDPTEVRQAYYNFHSFHEQQANAEGSPTRWTLDEDYAIFDCVSQYGRGEMGVHYIYMALGEKRSYDEIVERIHVIYPKKRKQYKTKRNSEHRYKLRGTVSDDGGDHCSTPSSKCSTWSIDDSLLVKT